MTAILDILDVRHGHLFCGVGSGAAGFNQGEARVGNSVARFRCLGGIDVDRSAIVDFERLTGVPGTVMDLFSLEQYRAFHGREPPDGWRAAGPADIHRAFGFERPHIAFLSAPCKGFSGLLAEATSRSAKYQALNELTLRGMWLLLEAFADDPVELIVFENVPRIATRGRPLLDQITGMLRHYGYAVAETTHDCGELGGLAQSRKRFLLVARHAEKVPPFLYEPPKRPLRGVGEVLGRMFLPGDPRGGPMHRVPSLQWKTWVRLAFVEAGSDWRSLNKLTVEDGVLRDYGILPEPELRSAALGVVPWAEPAGAVIGESFPTNGKFAVQDPRIEHDREGSGHMGVRSWEQPAFTVTGNGRPGSGPHAVADPRGAGTADEQHGKYRVTDFGEPSSTVIAGSTTGNGAFAVADPRATHGPNAHQNKMRVVGYDGPAPTITTSDRVGSGALSVADPRPDALSRDGRDVFLSQGHYGVVPWTSPSRAVTASGQSDNGHWSVADPRGLPAPEARLVCIIRALDGTWHRPFTTLELAALQSIYDPDDELLILDGMSDSRWREGIGNAVPRAAAKAIASTMGRTLLLAWSGQSFFLSADAIWVRRLEIALSVDTGAGA